MKINNTNIPDVKIIEPSIFGDERGFFMESWQQNKFNTMVARSDFVQDNISMSKCGILRGLHYQKENTQGKLVSVILGEVFDVAVDVRKNSPTLGEWAGEYLSSENKRQMWIPEGFAHGFLVTSEEAIFTYKCTDYYNPSAEITIAWNDPDIKIIWPIKSKQEPVLSAKDSLGIKFSEAILL